MKQNQCIYNTNMYIQHYSKKKNDSMDSSMDTSLLEKKTTFSFKIGVSICFVVFLQLRVSRVTQQRHKAPVSMIKIPDGIWQDCVISSWILRKARILL